MNRETAEWLACMVLASVGLVCSLWVVPYLPTSDGPQHILSVHIENHYADAGSLYPEFYRVLPQFAEKGFALVFAPLESILPWRVALRVTLSLMALAFAWGFALVALSIDSSAARRPTAMLGFAIALPWSLYMGLFQFVIGTTFGLYTLAFVLRRPPTTNARRVALSLMLLVQGVCHMFTAVLTGVLVLVLAVVAAPKGTRLREVGRMALVGSPALALLALAFQQRNVQRSEQQTFQWSLGERFSEISRWFIPGPGARAWLILALTLVAIGATLVRARRGKATGTERALAWLAVAFFVLTLCAPLHMPSWQFFSPRFCGLAMVLGLSLVRLPEGTSPRVARALVPVVTACCLGSDLVSANLHRRLADGCADALAGLDAPLHFEGPRYPMILDPICGTPRDPVDGPVPRALLAMNTPLLYLVEHGGIGTRMFNGSPAIFAIEFTGTRRPRRPDPTALEVAQSTFFDRDPKLRAAVLTELVADGMPFEGVHVLGARPADYAVFNARGYVTEFQRGPLFIGRFEGCAAEILLDPQALGGEPVRYEYGLFSETLLFPEPRALGAGVVEPDARVVDGRIHVPLERRPCGEIWVRVFWDIDRSSTFTPGDRTCDNGSLQGRIRANVSREHATVTCVSRAATSRVEPGRDR